MNAFLYRPNFLCALLILISAQKARRSAQIVRGLKGTVLRKGASAHFAPERRAKCAIELRSFRIKYG